MVAYCPKQHSEVGREQRSALAWWAEQLAGENLRRLSLAQTVIPVLDGTLAAPRKTKGRAHKIATLKALYAWLRKHRHLLTSAEDPTVDLAVPQATPAQRKKHKEYTPEQIAAVVRKLDPDRRRARLAAQRRVDLDQVRHMTDYRDHVQLAAATGWHVTELHRFATGGRVLDPTALQAQDGTEAILETVHKNGEVFRTRVGPTGAAAAKRIRATGGFSIERYAEAVSEAARVAGVPASAGRFGTARSLGLRNSKARKPRRSWRATRVGAPRRSTTQSGQRRRTRSDDFASSTTQAVRDSPKHVTLSLGRRYPGSIQSVVCADRSRSSSTKHQARC